MIITVTLNPALDKTVTLPGFAVNTVNRVQEIRLDPGGKGINVSKAVQALGGKTLAISILGGGTGGYIKGAMDAMGLPNEIVPCEDPTRTNLKIVDPVLGTNTDINEPGHSVSEEVLEKVWKTVSQTVQPGDTVVFAGKNPPGMAHDLLARWICQLKDRGARICVDTVGEPMMLALKERPHIIKPNQEELSGLVGRELATEQEVLEVARQLAADGIELVAVSMGSQGAVFVTEDRAVRAYSPKVKVGSTVGAGDSMMAALAYYTEAGCSLEETARRAVATAAAKVMCSGSEAAELPAILPLIEQVKLEEL